MNLRQFSIALLVSALPSLSNADTATAFTKSDFIAAEKVSSSGETVMKVKLSKSGKAKLKKLNQTSVDQNLHTDIAGVASDMKLKTPITGESLQMGPYPAADADKIVAEINR